MINADYSLSFLNLCDSGKTSNKIFYRKDKKNSCEETIIEIIEKAEENKDEK